MQQNIRLVAGVLFLGIVTITIWFQVLVFSPSNQELKVVFFDVGQGDAIFIEAPNGRQLLIDGGVSSNVLLRELGRVMSFWDRSLDVVLATHPDRDHIGGLPDVLRRFAVDSVIESGAKSDTDLDELLLQLTGVEGAKHLIARRGQRLWLDETAGVYVDILYPDQDVSEFPDTNDASIVARLVYGETEFLFTGDAPKEVEEYLVWLDSTEVKADVLKVGHHGSKTSTSDFFLGWVDPEFAVISAGRDNSYGHPHQEVLETLEKFEIDILSTAEEGRIEFVSDGVNLVSK